jgi:hypothetical protein
MTEPPFGGGTVRVTMSGRMSERSLAQRLVIRPGNRVAAINAPTGYRKALGELPAGVVLTAKPADADVILLFVRDRAELAREWPPIAGSVRDSAVVWISYPKKSGSLTTDLTRDVGWEPVGDTGFEGVSQVAVDDTWSALRFKRDPALRAAREARGAFGPGQRRPG